MFKEFAKKINEATGGSGEVDLRYKDFFVNARKKHSFEEAEEVFECGTRFSTPDIKNVISEWPKPWVYSRVLLALLVCTFMAYIRAFSMNMDAIFPGLMFLGAMVGPIPVLIFIFECNIPRNISFVSVLYIFFIGGLISLVTTSILVKIFPGGVGDLIPSMVTGITEEVAKVVATYYFIKKFSNKKYILNGLLIGAAVGAGFAVFETAGYLNNALYEVETGFFSSTITISEEGFNQTFFGRSLLSFGGHVAWAAVEGAALSITARKSGGVLRTDNFKDPTFLYFFGICVLLHGIWDTYIPEIIPIIGHLILCLLIWIVILVILNRGLKEIKSLSIHKALG